MFKVLKNGKYTFFPWPGGSVGLEHSPVHHKVAGLIPTQCTYLVVGSIPNWVCIGGN